MGVEEKLLKAYKESVEQLESTSALELAQRTGLFLDDLQKLVNRQHLLPTVIIGCLMNEIYRLNAEPTDMLLDIKLTDSFKLFKKYVDNKFMKKE